MGRKSSTERRRSLAKSTAHGGGSGRDGDDGSCDDVETSVKEAAEEEVVEEVEEEVVEEVEEEVVEEVEEEGLGVAVAAVEAERAARRRITISRTAAANGAMQDCSAPRPFPVSSVACAPLQLCPRCRM